MNLIVSLAIVFISLNLVSSGTINIKCLNSDSCDPNQFCSPSGICECNPGTTLFAGECEALAHHGEHCTKQIHCSLTRDPNLHCLSKDGSSSEDRICQCRNGYQLDGDVCQIIPGYSPSHTDGRIFSHEVERPSHISMSRPQPKLEDGIVDLRNTNLSQIFNRNYEKKPHKFSIFGPVVLVSTCILIFALCLCFWTVKRPEVLDEERRLNTRVLAHQKYLANQNGQTGLEEKINIGQSDMEKRGFAHDNPCYQGDNMDTLSHFTGNTDICETSHREYNENNPAENHTPPSNGISDVMGLSAQAQRPSPVIKNKLADRNVKMLFVNDPQQSLTPSMDEADHEVAGIYKTYSSLNPLTVRMDNLSTPPPLPPPPKEPHVIELVDTPDCTSIDTTLQEDLDDNQQLSKDETTMTSQRKNSKPNEVNPKNEESLSKETNSNDEEAMPEVGFNPQNHEQYSDFIENVFKPVFSIS